MGNPMNGNPGKRVEIPSWLLEKERWDDRGAKSGGTHFLAKTLHRFSEMFENEFFCERYAAKPMLLQRIDPRAKIAVLLGLMVFSAFCSSIVVLLALGVVALLYAGLSGLDLGDFLRRTWAYLPAVVFLCSLPGASSLITGGTPLFTVLRPGFAGLPNGLYFTAGGIAMAFRLALRPGISLSFAFLLLLTTRWTRITGALASLHVPALLISILNMAYRYIFVMSEMADDMVAARFLRTVGKLEAADNRRFVSRSAAQMFLKSHYLSEEVYDAMVCRGFAGKPVSAEEFRIKAADLVFVLNNFVILLALIAGEAIF